MTVITFFLFSTELLYLVNERIRQETVSNQTFLIVKSSCGFFSEAALGLFVFYLDFMTVSELRADLYDAGQRLKAGAEEVHPKYMR